MFLFYLVLMASFEAGGYLVDGCIVFARVGLMGDLERRLRLYV